MSVSRKLVVKRTVIGLAAAGLVSALLLAGCGAPSSTATTYPGTGTYQGTGMLLAAQTGTQSYLFYGNSDHTKLASIRNVKVIDPNNSSVVLIEQEGNTGGEGGTFPSLDGAMPKPSTLMVGYDAVTQSYTDFYVDSVKYVKGGTPSLVSMKNEGVAPVAQPHSNATGLKSPVYKEIEYLGTQVFLTANDASGNGVLICPKSVGDSTPMPFVNKDLLTIAYDSYGAASTGVIALNKTTGVLEHWTPGSSACAACGILGVDAVMTAVTGGPAVLATDYKFLGDIGGTAKSMLLIAGKLYILDKNTAAHTQAPTLTAIVPGTTFVAPNFKAFMDDSAYFIASGNITRVKADGTQIQVNSDSNANKIHGFTNDWVIYGYNDLSIRAARKDGTTVPPVLLSETTKTTGHRGSYDRMAWDNKLLYTKYTVAATGTTYQACMFDGDTPSHDMDTMTDNPYTISCKANGFWAAMTAAKQGKLNFKTSFPYTPYALLRMEVSDSNGGGTLLAVDAKTPMADGVTMGSVANYSFDSFMQLSTYRLSMIDSEGYIVVYGKDDLNVKGDAFMVNLTKANSLVNLTSETSPAENVISNASNALHCHGRTCSTCHNFAAGKIYTDGTGALESMGHNIRFKFQDGTTKMARKGKGKGENFNLPLKDIVDNFTVEVVRESDQTVVNSSQAYGHAGKDYANCDYCHAKAVVDRKYAAPGTISTVPVP